MRHALQLTVVVAGTLALGASASAPAKHQVESTSRIGAPPDATWEAVIDLFAERQWPIKTSDRASGLITTDPMRSEERFAGCGSAPLARTVANAATFNIRVKDEGAGSSLQVNITFRQEREFDGRHMIVDCESRGVAEAMIRQEVDRRAYVIARRQKKAKQDVEQQFFCTSAPADATLGACARSEAGCAKKQQEIISAAGDATACTRQPRVVCFKGVTTEGINVENCHPTPEACARSRDKSDLLDTSPCQ